MKTLTTYINEKLVLNKDTFKKQEHKYFPNTPDELQDILKTLIKKRKNDDVINLNDIDTSGLTSMDGVFYDSTFINIKKIDISRWDVSNVKNMTYMFYNCINLESVGDLSLWDVSEVRDMKWMFGGAKNINVDLSSWNVSNVVNMDTMFFYCLNFDFSTIEHWNVSNVKNMDDMFCNCNHMNADFSNWETKNLESMNEMFINCISFTGKGLENWKTDKLRYMNDTFGGCKKLDCNLNNWQVSELIEYQNAFSNCPKKSIPEWYILLQSS